MVDNFNLVEGCNTWNLIPNIEAFLIMFIVFFGKESMCYYPLLYLLKVLKQNTSILIMPFKENCKEILIGRFFFSQSLKIKLEDFFFVSSFYLHKHSQVLCFVNLE